MINGSNHEDNISITCPVNLDHLELLYHFQTETCKPICLTSEDVEAYRTTVISRALRNPFLMYEILALSATHLSLERPTRAAFYHNMALQLQSQALAGYHEVFPRLDASNCIDALLFSHALALQVFSETFTLLRNDFNAFLEKLAECISLLMGINMVIRPWWHTIRASPIGSIMFDSHSSLNDEAPKHTLGECNALRDLITQADLSRPSIDTCLEALKRLQMYFDVEHILENSANSTNLLFGWLVTSTPEYNDLIEQRRPEALIILAYYAVILDKRRGTWAVRDAGKLLLASITRYLGNGWEPWLVWPNSIVNSTSNET
jgi:hypothetical protein